MTDKIAIASAIIFIDLPGLIFLIAILWHDWVKIWSLCFKIFFSLAMFGITTELYKNYQYTALTIYIIWGLVTTCILFITRCKTNIISTIFPYIWTVISIFFLTFIFYKFSIPISDLQYSQQIKNILDLNIEIMLNCVSFCAAATFIGYFLADLYIKSKRLIIVN